MMLIESLVDALKLIFTLDKEVLSITFLSLKVSGLAIIIGALIGIPFALLLSQKNFFGKKIVINLVHTFMALPPVVVGLFVYLILSRNGALGGLDLLFSPLAMIIAQLIMVIPIITGISMSAINKVDNIIKDTITSLGATTFQKIKGILKEARFGLVTAIVTAFGAAISEVGAIIIVGGNIRFHTRALTTAIVLETRRGNFELAMALGIILIVIAFIINYALTSVQQRIAKR